MTVINAIGDLSQEEIKNKKDPMEDYTYRNIYVEKLGAANTAFHLPTGWLFYFPYGNYSASFYREMNNTIIRMYRYLNLNRANNNIDLKMGGILTNNFILDYSNNNLDVYLYLNDSFGNTSDGNFQVRENGFPVAVNAELVLEDPEKGTSYSSSIIKNNYNYFVAGCRSFQNKGIPDGKYTLKLKYNKPVSIFEIKFTDMNVEIKNGKFHLAQPNNPPKVVYNPEYIFTGRYETLRLDLNKVFEDSENDRLYYKVNEGYIIDNKYYLESSNPGIKEIQITACDMKGGEATVNFSVIADIETLVMTPSLIIDFVPDFTGASTWAVLDMLEAVSNGIVTENIMGSYQKPVTREEFCVFLMNFYNRLSKKDQQIKIKDPFKDTNNPDILKAYSLGIIDGISADKFEPNGYVTKELMCTAMLKTLMLLNPGMSMDKIEEHKFSDADQISPSARNSIYFCISNGIITVDGNNKINPKNNLSREQVIVIANRAYRLFARENSK